jgi:AGZA family xanthine/uracil permease-like MFS transporter
MSLMCPTVGRTQKLVTGESLYQYIFKEETPMKKLLALILALVMCFGLVACGSKDEAKGGDTAGNLDADGFVVSNTAAPAEGTTWRKEVVFAGGTSAIVNANVLTVTFTLVDMFDTIGTLYGTASQADMLDENGDPVDVDKAMTCDSVATVSGALLGTSTCTTFVESAAGVAVGGRTGLTSLVTSICFALCLFLSPIAAIVPGCATAPALIYVGVLMLKNFAKVDMSDITSAVPAFFALIMMPLTYSISNGIAVGAIAYVLITLFSCKFTKKDIVVTVIAILFSLRFFLVTM